MVGPAFELIPKLLRLLNDPDVNCERIADFIRVDPALTAEVIRTANAAGFGGIERADSLTQAISRTGLRAVTRSVVKLVGANALSAKACVGYRKVNLWRHSLATGLAAKILAARFTREDPEFAYTAGLLHDLGKVVFARAAGAAYVEILDECARLNRCVYAAEREAFESDHMEVAGHMLRHWGFPQGLIEGVENHHAPERQAGGSPMAALVHLGSAIAYRLGEGHGRPEYADRPSVEALRQLGIESVDLPVIQEETVALLAAEYERLQ